MGREFCFSLACLSLVLTTNGQTMAGIILDFRADDPALAYGSVPAWQDLAVADGAQNATPLGTGPIKTTTIINGFLKDVVRFTGGSVGTPLVSLTQLPIAGGSIFLVMKSTDTGGSNRIIGWEDASHGANGVALLTNYGGFGFDAVFRQSGTVGDIADISPNSDYEIIAMTWGASGSYFSRMDRFGNTTFESHNSSITAVTSIGLNLHIGSSGTPDRDGKWGGDLLELTLYDEQLDAVGVAGVLNPLNNYWFQGGTAAVPEPSTLIIWSLIGGIFGVTALRKRTTASA